VGPWEHVGRDPILIPGRIRDESGSVQNNNNVRVLARITARSEKIDEPRSFCYSSRRKHIKKTKALVVEGGANDLAIDSHMRSGHVQNAFDKSVPVLATTPKLKDIVLLDSGSK
jgi:quinol monooxygenase YgiN